jgi:RNA polymerase sigma factor (sigma-70 family)
MPGSSSQALTDDLQFLFDVGTFAGLTDGDLIDRFREVGAADGERAFEALVTRHGPMVLGVCRHFLTDPVALHDAFQASFLVLARRGGAIRNRESVGSWLYGVALRVAARGRVYSIRREIRDRRVIAAVRSTVVPTHESRADASVEVADGAAVVHQEVGRLPEKYRSPVVLCYLEGMTHEEAAARLGWPVGTVRSRLSQARSMLRVRLTRRGITAPSAIGPVAAWLVRDTAPSMAAAGSSVLPAGLAPSVARAATRFAFSQTAAAGSLPAAAAELAQGVLTTMLLKKLTIAGCIVLSLGIATTGGGALLLGRTHAQDPKPAADESGGEMRLSDRYSVRKPTTGALPRPVDVDPQLAKLLAAARARVDAQKAYYEEGRMTVDRFIDGLERLEKAELFAAKTDADRAEIRKRHVSVLEEIAKREDAEIQVGRGTIADLSEARQRHLEAEYEMKIMDKEAAEKTAILGRLSELERKVAVLQQGRTEKSAGSR